MSEVRNAENAPIDHLTLARDEANYVAVGGISTPSSPDERTIPTLLAGILDALVALNDRIDRLAEYRIPPDKDLR